MQYVYDQKNGQRIAKKMRRTLPEGILIETIVYRKRNA